MVKEEPEVADGSSGYHGIGSGKGGEGDRVRGVFRVARIGLLEKH